MAGSAAMNHPRPQLAVRAKLRAKAQLTLPEEIRKALHVNEGNEIEFALWDDGTITVRGYIAVPADQVWRYGKD